MIGAVLTWVYGIGLGVTSGLLVIGAAGARRRGDKVTWRDVRMVVLDSVLWFVFWPLVLSNRKARNRLMRIWRPRTV